jgi:putative membrane protein
MLVQKKFSVVEVVRSIWRPLLVLFLLDCLVTAAYVGLKWTWIAPREVPLPLIGTGLAVFLGLRNNTAYSRWWEARTLWGSITNHSRNFARSLAMLLPSTQDDAAKAKLIQHQIAWAHALRASLRREDVEGVTRPFLPAETLAAIQASTNAPFAIQREMAALLADAARRGRLDPIQAAALNTTLSALTDAQGGLERIRNTPMPRQYALFPRIFVGVYCLMLPFGVVPDLGVLTPVGSTLIGFIFLALDAAGRNLEDPFARSVHDVPMSAITRTIEIDLKQALGHSDDPIPLRPIRGVLR